VYYKNERYRNTLTSTFTFTSDELDQMNNLILFFKQNGKNRDDAKRRVINHDSVLTRDSGLIKLLHLFYKYNTIQIQIKFILRQGS